MASQALFTDTDEKKKHFRAKSQQKNVCSKKSDNRKIAIFFLSFDTVAERQWKKCQRQSKRKYVYRALSQNKSKQMQRTELANGMNKNEWAAAAVAAPKKMLLEIIPHCIKK